MDITSDRGLTQVTVLQLTSGSALSLLTLIVSHLVMLTALQTAFNTGGIWRRYDEHGFYTAND